MGKNTGIDWTDNTWNPWQGCHKVSPGCHNCYMFRDKTRFHQDPEKVVRSSDATFNMPYRWKDPAKVFVCSWSDFFIGEANPWRDEAWTIIKKNPHLTFQLLTKRPESVIGEWPVDGWPENAWLGVTAENQRMAEDRIPKLLLFPAPVKFVSVEPMLNVVDLTEWLPDLDWVICGGESGPEKRIQEMDPVWAVDLLYQCRKYGVPFFMKQMSGNTKKKRMDIPEHLNVREWPECSSTYV